MHLNNDPVQQAPKPCIRDYANLVNTLLPDTLVALTPLMELERRCQEINYTHPQYREETPIVLELERRRRARLSTAMAVTVRQSQVA